MKTCRNGDHCPWRPACRYYHPKGGNSNKSSLNNPMPVKKYSKPIMCRNGDQCNWRPNCKFYHPKYKKNQGSFRREPKDLRDYYQKRTIGGSSSSRGQDIYCYRDGSCSGDNLVARTQNPGGYWYEGGLRQCLPDGRGVMEYEEGLYQGEWRKGDRHGLGRAEYWNDVEYVSQYLGDWEKGKWDGEGVSVLRNGKVFDGIFRHNCRSGRGKLIMISGSFIEGTWRKCRLVDEATITFVDDEDNEKILDTAKIVMQGFDQEIWFNDCEDTETYDTFLENVIDDISSMVLKGRKGPFVISKHLVDKQNSSKNDVTVDNTKQMMKNLKI